MVMEGERRLENNRSKTVVINEVASLDCDGSDWSDAVMVDFMDEENAEMLAEEELRKPVHTLPEPGRVAELLVQSIAQKYNMTADGQQDKQPKAAESEQHNDE